MICARAREIQSIRWLDKSIGIYLVITFTMYRRRSSDFCAFQTLFHSKRYASFLLPFPRDNPRQCLATVRSYHELELVKRPRFRLIQISDRSNRLERAAEQKQLLHTLPSLRSDNTAFLESCPLRLSACLGPRARATNLLYRFVFVCFIGSFSNLNESFATVCLKRAIAEN